ncbi:hypothetical protein N7474_010160 [Penicillium riverlandense]|uniref:uncharacterized protein n=1 Tax=Penicillium riverlandense TaxID=1903569 RepID=UPI002546E6F4|nr:uncharacterized protein N7474_010160 [Penicillium riverlandense]KAJ5808891.1 hypothetical protein N7474_010160 [Penicillium riverlandense]
MTLQQQLSKCLGSVFADENRGDLDSAWSILEELKLAIDENNLEAKADLLDDHIGFYLLTGKLDEAYRCLDEFHALLGQLGPRWELLYAVVKGLIDHHRRHPPILGFAVELDGIKYGPPSARVPDTFEILLELDRCFKKFSSSGLSLLSERHACLVLHRVITCQTARISARKHHPLYPAERPQEDDSLLQLLMGEQQDAANRAPESRDLHFGRLLLTIHYDKASPACEDMSREHFARYEAKGDKVGMANCKLLQADAMISSPFTSPVILNLVPPVLPGAAGTSPLYWNACEAQCPLKNCQGAAQLYEEALELYQQASAPRGQAAIFLRQGCVLHAQACDVGPDHEDWEDLVEAASHKFSASLALFGVDEASAQLVKSNQILLACSRGYGLAEAKAQSAEIGNWGTKHKNEILGRTLGIFIMRFARREWTSYGRFRSALWAYECAEYCLAALGEAVHSLASILDRALMHKDVHNGPNALLLAQRCVNIIDTAIQWYDEQLALPISHPIDAENRKSVEVGVHSLISDFNHHLRSIYGRCLQQELLAVWDRKYKTLVQHAAYQNADMVMSRMHVPEESMYTRADIKRMEQEEWRRFIDADIASHKSLINGDVRGSERAYEEYLDSTEGRDITYCQPAHRIIACRRLADVTRARAILDSCTDQEIFYQMQSLLPIPRRHLSNTFAHNALYQCVVAQDWERADRFLGNIEKDWPSFWTDFGSQESVDIPLYSLTIALIDLHNNRVTVAFRRLLDARHNIELERRSTDDPDVKPGVMNTAHVIDVYMTLAEICLLCLRRELPRAILNCYDFGHPSVTWEEHALLFVEEARARSTLDALRKVGSEDMPDESLAQREKAYKRRAILHLQSLRKRKPAQQRELERLQLEIGPDESSNESRLMRAAEHPVHPIELSSLLPDEDVVIEASFYATGSILFAVTSKGIEASRQSTVRDIDIRKWAMESLRLLQLIAEGPTPRSGLSEFKMYSSALNDYCSKLAEAIIVPFAGILRQKRHIIFSVSRPLNAFPFSMLPFNNQPLIKHAAVSQTPSLTVLHHLMQRAPTTRSPSISVFAKSLSERGSASDDPDIAFETKLPWAAVEALQLANLFSTWPIECSKLSRDEFRDHVRSSSSILHISTHGYTDPEYPLLSWISFAEKFRVLDLSMVHSTANLIVFAACLSGLGQATSGSDIMGFTHVILGTGCQAYLGGLIEINDFASMMLMIMFYRNLKRDAQLSLAESLRQAQLEFMQINERKATRFLDELLDQWDKMRHHEENADSFCPHGRERLEFHKSLPHMVDWASPHLWAPFTLMGYGGLTFGMQQRT